MVTVYLGFNETWHHPNFCQIFFDAIAGLYAQQLRRVWNTQQSENFVEFLLSTVYHLGKYELDTKNSNCQNGLSTLL